jgi:hypothetical protein
LIFHTSHCIQFIYSCLSFRNVLLFKRRHVGWKWYFPISSVMPKPQLRSNIRCQIHLENDAQLDLASWLHIFSRKRLRWACIEKHLLVQGINERLQIALQFVRLLPTRHSRFLHMAGVDLDSVDCRARAVLRAEIKWGITQIFRSPFPIPANSTDNENTLGVR